MYYITIDCGTTNSRAYVVKKDGTVCGRATKKVGVRDTSLTGTKDTLREGLGEIIEKAVADAGIAEKDVGAIFSSGMITSEIGLCELPHLTAPCDINELADHIEEMRGVNLYGNKPVYFVRGIKNERKTEGEDPFAVVGELDFMRGEETQVIGIIEKKDITLPAAIVILSSHTKFISVDDKGFITGSLTTMSGQTYEAIKDYTFLGKSLENVGTGKGEKDYFNESIVKAAIDWIHKAGIIRSFMFPRFLDVLLNTKWYERKLFFEALIAAEDMLAFEQLNTSLGGVPEKVVLVGIPQRCKLYEYMFTQIDSDIQVLTISETEEIDSLSIYGILSIAKKAGILNDKNSNF